MILSRLMATAIVKMGLRLKEKMSEDEKKLFQAALEVMATLDKPEGPVKK